MTLPATYAVQDGCHNCRYVFVRSFGNDWLHQEFFMCAFGVANSKDVATYDREVHPAGKCGEWLGPDDTAQEVAE